MGHGPDEPEAPELAHDRGNQSESADVDRAENAYAESQVDDPDMLVGDPEPVALEPPSRRGARPLPRPRGRITSRRTAWWIAGVLLLCFVYWSPKADWNQDARVDMS